MAERKLVIVKDNTILPELGGIGGPILTPTRITYDAILKMINNKRHVFECYPNDPRNEELWVELTNANYKSDNFNKPQEPENQKSDPVPNPDVTTPVTQQEPTNSDPTSLDPASDSNVQMAINDDQKTNSSDPETVTDPDNKISVASQEPENQKSDPVPNPDVTTPVTQQEPTESHEEDENHESQQVKSSKKNKKNK